MGKFYQGFNQQILSMLLKLLQNIKKGANIPKSFQEASITIVPKLDICGTNKSKSHPQITYEY